MLPSNKPAFFYLTTFGKILILWLGLLASASGQHKTIELPTTLILDGPSETPEALYVQRVLETAYAQIGYTVTYGNVPLARSYIEANAGRLDGLRARVDGAVENYSNLMKVPFEILNFEMVLIANRSKCGACSLSNIGKVAVARGFKAFEDYRQSQRFPIDVLYLTTPEQAFNLLISGKVNGVIMSTTNLPKAYDSLDQNWIKTTLSTLPDFHYLHKKRRTLIPQLLGVLKQMDASGQLLQLQQKYQVNSPSLQRETPEFGTIGLVTDSWGGYTDTPESTYIKAVRQVYSTTAQGVTTKRVNWKRAKQLFYDQKADILVGAYAFEEGENGRRSDIHIDYEYPVIAFAKQPQRLAKLLAGDGTGTACYLLGYGLDSVLPDNIISYEVGQPADCLRLLENDRIDMILNYEVDLPAQLVQQYAKQQVLDAQPLFVVFHNTPRGQALKSVFETGFRKLINSGQLRTYFPSNNEYDNANFEISTAEQITNKK
ncbi:hypothetical protein [Aliiglaciecola sp. LCG003]|uniref:hypothetical protein n=1 Tax=Aliiglaciecola sp. LCG003 TaxID=3053655 RepID=UPI0025737067|nr:hypothetical protein [Aliiglaciecola sp. LCG003]WJG08915.1 hypothetical protein QR722_16495 [Aliiglaciecola sp. LCG003]